MHTVLSDHSDFNFDGCFMLSGNPDDDPIIEICKQKVNSIMLLPDAYKLRVRLLDLCSLSLGENNSGIDDNKNQCNEKSVYTTDKC